MRGLTQSNSSLWYSPNSHMPHTLQNIQNCNNYFPQKAISLVWTDRTSHHLSSKHIGPTSVCQLHGENFCHVQSTDSNHVEDNTYMYCNSAIYKKFSSKLVHKLNTLGERQELVNQETILYNRVCKYNL